MPEVFFIDKKNYLTGADTGSEICIYLITINTKKAVIKKSIKVDNTLPYNTHL